MTTARRETLRLLRERTRDAAGDATCDDPAPDPVDPDPLPDALIEQLQLHDRVRQVLELLPEPCRSLLSLLYCEDEPRPYAERSARLDMPEGSIGPTRARCLAKLRKLIESMS